MFALGFGDGMRRRIERQSSDDHLRQRCPRYIDPGPKTIGAEKNRIAERTHLVGEFRAGQIGALHEEGAPRGSPFGLQRKGDRAHIGVARKED